jgi:hypothetical protein
MAGNITSIYVEDDVCIGVTDNFIREFMRECKKMYPNLIYDNIKIFDRDRNIYMFDFVPENGYVFDIFINDNDDRDDKYINYYKDIWKGKTYNTYIIMTDKNKDKNTYNFMLVYCGSCLNLIISSINEYLDDFWKRCENFMFADNRSKLEYMYETL